MHILLSDLEKQPEVLNAFFLLPFSLGFIMGHRPRSDWIMFQTCRINLVVIVKFNLISLH